MNAKITIEQSTTFASLTQSRTAIICGVLIFSLSACSIFNPHVTSTEPRPIFYGDGAAQPATPSTSPPSPPSCGKQAANPSDPARPVLAGGLGPAICYVQGFRDAYQRAVGNDALLRNVTALGIIPLTAVAAYLGLATNDNRGPIAALGVSAVSLFGLSSYLQSTPRQRVYLAGSQAMGCLLLSAEPLMMSEADMKMLSDHLDKLYRAIGVVRFDRQDLQAKLDNSVIKGANADEGRAAIALADVSIADAERLLAAGKEVSRSVAHAGFILTVAADNIAARVDDMIVSTEPDLSSLLGIASGISGSVTKLTPLPPSGNDKLKEQKEKLQAAGALEVQGLRDAIADLATAMAEVAPRVDAAISRQQFREQIAGCKVEKPGSDFAVAPDDEQQIIAAGATLTFVISGGSGVPRAGIAGDNIAGVTLTPVTIVNGAFVATVTAAKDTAGGEFQIVFTDGSGLGRRVVGLTVSPGPPSKEIEKKAPAAPPQVAQICPPAREVTALRSGPQRPSLSAEEAAFAKHQISSAQRGLNKSVATGLKDDGELGRDTLLAVGSYQQSKGKAVDFCLSQALLLELTALDKAGSVAATPAIPEVCKDKAPPLQGAKSEFEKTVICPSLVTVQQAIGLNLQERTGIFDDPTRRAFKVVRQRDNLSEPGVDDTTLTKKLFDHTSGGG